MANRKRKLHREEATTPAGRSVFEQLRREILDGTLNDGERIVEADIARRLKVSRTPIREALRKLEAEGLVQYQPGRGVTVAKVSPEDLDELYAIRGVIEGLCARLAAPHMTPGKIAVLRKLLQRMSNRYERNDLGAVVQLHRRFNDLVSLACLRPRVRELADRYREYTERGQLRSIQFLPGRFAAVLKEHQAIVEALEKRQAGTAESACRHYVEQSRNAYFRTLEQWEAWLMPDRPRTKKHSHEKE